MKSVELEKRKQKRKLERKLAQTKKEIQKKEAEKRYRIEQKLSNRGEREECSYSSDDSDEEHEFGMDEEQHKFGMDEDAESDTEPSDGIENLTQTNNTPLRLPTATTTTIDVLLKCKEKRVDEMLGQFVASEVFPELKFVGKSHLLPILQEAIKKNNFMDYRGTIPQEVFDNHFAGKVSTVFSKMRHKTQCLARTTFLSRFRWVVLLVACCLLLCTKTYPTLSFFYLPFKEESRSKDVPQEFPDGVLQERQDYKGEAGEARYTIHPDYRKEDSKAWRYFATKYLPCVNAKYTNYKLKNYKELISEIFTASDEAYALSLLINEYDNYKFALENTLGRGGNKPKKPFTNSRSGKSSGWNTSGLETYKSLLARVDELRQEKVSSELEHTLLNWCQTQSARVGRHLQKKNRVQVPEFDLLSTLDKGSKVYKFLVGSSKNKD